MARAEQARTRLARAAVTDAARTLFLARGYGATTIDAISEAAGVPEPTVYRLFSSKVGILKSLIDVSIAGDATDVPLAERPPVREVFDDPDPHRRIVGFAAIVVAVNARVGPLYRILSSAAGSDPEAADAARRPHQQRQAGQQALVRSLAATLQSGVTPRAAADVVHALASPEVYHLFVVDRGLDARPLRAMARRTSLVPSCCRLPVRCPAHPASGAEPHTEAGGDRLRGRGVMSSRTLSRMIVRVSSSVKVGMSFVKYVGSGRPSAWGKSEPKSSCSMPSCPSAWPCRPRRTGPPTPGS